MRVASQELLALLQTRPFKDSLPDECAAAAAQWQSKHQLEPAALTSLLTQFGAQLLHAVRSNQLAPQAGSELLARLITFSDFDIPASLYALQEVLQNLAEQQRGPVETRPDSELFVRREMGRILPTLPQRDSHQSDACRYTGRYAALRRSA
ncbi:hypothetical protein HPT27_17860 [Permianibacter sp. IMCC34836]|uniref:hypothetical protein n=1 Tax=Permianibacter fluminis TaxID=2738515 RepID=UPI001555A7A6|nr:hypothetical protein [Permianibacter fluminis]NQD38886.1 hypothetical protein [Permianibacter fluminis]